MSGLPLKPRFILVCLFIAIILVLASPHASYSQFIPCNIVNLSISHPDLVPAAQPLQVTSTLTTSCDPGTFYVIRVDLVDAGTTRVLSTVTYPYYPASSSFITPPIVNEVTAPMFTGNWALEVKAYVSSGLSGQTVASTSQLFSINIVPYTPSTTTMQAVTTTSTVPTSSFSQTSTTSSTSQETFATQAFSSTSTQNIDQTGTIGRAAAVIALAFVIIGILTIGRRRQRTAKERKERTTGMKYCGYCGTKLQENAQFCGHCGAKQSCTQARYDPVLSRPKPTHTEH